MWNEQRRWLGKSGVSLKVRILGLGALLALTACGGESSDAGASAEGAVEGVSAEEMVGQAAPMTLEEAERLGIVDTTISVGDPVGPDSLGALGRPPGTDSVAAP